MNLKVGRGSESGSPPQRVIADKTWGEMNTRRAINMRLMTRLFRDCRQEIALRSQVLLVSENLRVEIEKLTSSIRTGTGKLRCSRDMVENRTDNRAGLHARGKMRIVKRCAQRMVTLANQPKEVLTKAVITCMCTIYITPDTSRLGGHQ